jgi:hypothetical protein
MLFSTEAVFAEKPLHAVAHIIWLVIIRATPPLTAEAETNLDEVMVVACLNKVFANILIIASNYIY